MGWTRGPTIGRGSTAVVSLATTAAGDNFAVKSAELSSSALLYREENLLSGLCSPYVIRCFGSDVTREDHAPVYNLFLEYVPGGALSDQIKKRGVLEESEIRSHARRILLGLNYIHEQGIAHCDVKGGNLLVGDGGLKIADFGCAKRVESGEPAAFSGTPAYMSPEVARGEEQSFPADIWAMGCTVIEMATGSAPWPEMRDPVAALYRIGFSDDIPEFPRWLSNEAKDLLAKCLMRDPRERWTAGQLLRHPFFISEEEEETVDCGGGEFTRKSPTSVMEQGFWDALDSSDCSRNPTEIVLPLDSPSGRVDDLVVGFPGWEYEENWMTVRGDEVEESVVEEENDSLFSMEFEEDRDSDSYSTTLVLDDFCVIGSVETQNHVNGIISSSCSRRSLFSWKYHLKS